MRTMTFHSRMTCFLTLAVLAVLMAGTVAAQTTSGSIAGSVVDAQHGAVPNATVTLSELEKNFSLTSNTDAAGRFVFPQVPPGHYRVSVQASGFKEFTQSGITLNSNDRLSLGELTMQVGAVNEHVEVSAEVVTLQTESAERGEALVGKQITNIAVNSRSPLDLVKLVPGVVSTVNLQTAGPGGLSAISANGNRLNSNQVNINGIGNTDTGSNGSVNVTVSLDSIAEFKILTGVYQAEYGRAMGAQINMVTKSGGSDLHGSGYYSHRNDSLNANNWLNNRNGTPRNLFRFNDVGFTVGGPVVIPKVFNGRQKLFFFVSEEFQRQLRPQGARNQTMPTTAERNGDFSNSVDSGGNKFSVIDPLTHLAFPSNTIPQARLYAPGVALLKMLPSPNVANSCALQPGTAGCIKGYDYTSQVSDQYPRREDLVRMDYNLTDKQRIFGHWIYNNNTYVSQYGSFVLGANVPLGGIQYANPGRSWAVGHSWVLSPTMTNEFNIGSTYNSILIDELGTGYTRTATGAALPLLYPSAVQRDYVPNVAFAGRIANGPNFGTSNAPFINHNTTLDITDNISKVWGKHSFKFGTYINKSWKDQTSFGAFNGTYNFSDNSANPFDTGFGFSNAALGVYNNFQQAANAINGLYRYWNFEFFAQDTWKITPRLTLDYGIRAAYYQPQYDESLQAATFVANKFDASKAPRFYFPTSSSACPPGTSGGRCGYDSVTNTYVPTAFIGFIVPNSGSITNDIFQGGQGGISKYLQDTRPPQWGPRIGIAWDVTGKQNFVVRTGIGVYYDRFQGNRVFDFVRNPPLGIQPSLNYGYMKDISPSSALLSPPTLYAADQPGKIPTSYNYTLGIQTRLPYGFVLDTAFVGSQFRHLQDNKNINYVPFKTTFASGNQDPTLAKNCAYNSDGSLASNQPGLCGNSALPNQYLRGFKGFSDTNLYESQATGNYNSLQMTLQKRVGRLFIGAAYTWSKDLTTATGDTNFVRPDQFNRLANYGPSGNDRPQSFALNYVYDLPDKGSNTFSKIALHGWQVSGVTRFQSGAPFTPGIGITGVGNANITGSTTEPTRLAVVSGQSPNTDSSNPYNRINAGAFAAPRVGSLGLESGVNYLYVPGINNWDLSLQKSFKLGPGDKAPTLQLRADAFNVFNHTQFSGLNTTLNFAVLNPNTNSYGAPTLSQNGVFGSVINGNFIPVTPSNLYKNANGTTNINGFGTVNGARDPRIMQLFMRITF